MKPFCSGNRADVKLIQAIQGEDPPKTEINPFFFAAPVAPLIAARSEGRPLELTRVLRSIERMRARCDCLIVEGAGGLLSPLGEGFDAGTLIERLRGCDVVVVAPNRLGTINHTLLTVEALASRVATRPVIVLMAQRASDPSAKSNAAFLRERLAPVAVLAFPFLGGNASSVSVLIENTKRIKKTLAQLADPDSFSPRSSRRRVTPRSGPAEKTKKDR